MPLYTIENKETKEREDVLLSWENLKKMLAELGEDWHQVPVSASFITGAKGVHSQTSDGFRDVLRGIKKANRGSNIYVK